MRLRERKLLVRAALAAAAALGAGPALALPAFPTALGYGMDTPGGRGGAIIEVTNLNNEGPGSLREALNTPGPRYVIFRVGGMIELTADLPIKEPFVTVAGQTAPGDGICIKNGPLRVSFTHDVVVRHFCSRPGEGQGSILSNRDALQIDSSQRVVIDHFSGSWSVDELAQVWFDASTDVTIQWSIFAEALADGGHPEGAHAMGPLLGPYTGRLTLHHNLISQNAQRNPRYAGVAVSDFVNNVIFNWRDHGLEVAQGQGSTQANVLNIVGNVFRRGPQTATNTFHLSNPIDFDQTKLYIEDNVNELGQNVDDDVDDQTGAWQLIQVDEPLVPIFGVVPEAHETVLSKVLRRAGRSRPFRDEVDARIVADVRNDVGRIVNTPIDVGGYPDYQGGTPYPDDDHDGMNDGWEISTGWTEPHEDGDGDGYTNLEEFLNMLAGDQ